jgi:hypothetical protein
MAKQVGPVKIEGTIGGITFLKQNGKYIAKEKSSLKGSTVKKSWRFKRSRINSDKFGMASKLGSQYYHKLPVLGRNNAMYQRMMGDAQILLCAGSSLEEVKSMLEKMVAELTAKMYRKKRRR